jgi:hypothetical protein
VGKGEERRERRKVKGERRRRNERKEKERRREGKGERRRQACICSKRFNTSLIVIRGDKRKEERGKGRGKGGKIKREKGKARKNLTYLLVTKDPSAKANAWQSFEALELLNNVSGITGTYKVREEEKSYKKNLKEIDKNQSSRNAKQCFWHRKTVYMKRTKQEFATIDFSAHSTN